jgi:hypothetical protein
MAEATYELRLRGVVSRDARSVFDELEMQSETLVSGVIQDQAALHGLLERIRDLGLELIDVHQVTDPPTSLEPAGPGPDSSGDAPGQHNRATRR